MPRKVFLKKRTQLLECSEWARKPIGYYERTSRDKREGRGRVLARVR